MKYSLILVLIFFTTVVSSSTSLEQERLSRLVTELELVRNLAETIQDQIKNKDEQIISFQYDSLIKTLKELEYGVIQHIALQNRSPREHWDLGVVTEEKKR